MITRICKECFKTYSGKPDTCPNCGAVLNTPKPVKEKKQKTKKVRRKRLSSQAIMDGINFEDLVNKTTDDAVKNWRAKKKDQEKKPEFTVDQSGEYNVNVKDVTYLPNTHTYSAKKARGEYNAPKIKWWEIYKWADLLLARRKIKKQVNKASQYRPEPFKKSTALTLCIFFGYMGAHNFYVRNYRKAIFMLIATIIGSFVTLTSLPFFEYIRISIGGGLLFIVLCMWFSDLINLIINKFSYRLSKWKFIDCLNTDTRATLGLKYVDKEEYKKPWIVRMVNKAKRASEERKAKKSMAKKQEQEVEKQEPANLGEQTQIQTENSKLAEPIKEEKPDNKKSKQNKNKKAKIVVKTKK